MKKIITVVILAGLAFLGIVLYSEIQSDRERAEVIESFDLVAIVFEARISDFSGPKSALMYFKDKIPKEDWETGRVFLSDPENLNFCYNQTKSLLKRILKLVELFPFWHFENGLKAEGEEIVQAFKGQGEHYWATDFIARRYKEGGQKLIDAYISIAEDLTSVIK